MIVPADESESEDEDERPPKAKKAKTVTQKRSKYHMGYFLPHI